jgi:hypothetical protein
MLLLALQDAQPSLSWGTLIDIPLDFATWAVLLLFIAGPLLVWWANRTSSMERYGAKPAEPEDTAANASGPLEDPASPTPLRQETRDGAAAEGRTPGSARRVRKEKSAPRT